MAETMANGDIRIKTTWLPHIARALTVAGGLWAGYEILKTQVADLKAQMSDMQKFKIETMVQNAVVSTELKEINKKLDRLLRRQDAR